MKRIGIVALALLLVGFMSAAVFAADKDAIKANVDEVVAAIDGGKDAAEFAADAYDPYVFIMEEGGNLIVHPSLAGESLKEKAGPVYDALVAATADGVWVDYEWPLDNPKKKHSYVKKTSGGLIVGSGYTEE